MTAPTHSVRMRAAWRRGLAGLLLVARAAGARADDATVRVLVWDERQPEQKQAYGGRFLGDTLAAHLAGRPGLAVRSVGLDDPQQGWSEAALDAADVLVVWCHRRVREQDDARAEAVVERVRAGRLGLVALHSAHWAKPFVRLMQERAKADALAALPAEARATARWIYTNTTPYQRIVKADARLTPHVDPAADGAWVLTLPQCVFPAWRADGAPSHVATLLPQHPIAAGLPERWDIPRTEMYGEPFHVPPPDEVVFEETWDRGERFRSGCVWRVGRGRVFYFRPGHETFPVFQQAEPLQVIENAVRWLGRAVRATEVAFRPDRDLIALHYDHAPDLDDGHSAAADRMILESQFGLAWITQHVVAVSGAYGRNAKTFNAKSDAVMDATWNEAGGWLGAHTNRDQVVASLVRRWGDVLRAGGDVWVKEGGQSDLTAAVVERLVQSEPDLPATRRIHVIQHSDWNERQTTEAALDYVRANTDYRRIRDANAYLNVKGGAADFEQAARNHPIFGPAWRAAFTYYDPRQRLDFSDTGELMHILSLGELNVAACRARFLQP